MPFHSLLFLGQICFSLRGGDWAPPWPCHAQDSLLGSSPRTMLGPEVLSPASPNWRVQAWAKASFVLSQWGTFLWAWMAQQKLLDALQGGRPERQSLCWKLCTLFWVFLTVPVFFLLVYRVNSVALEWGVEGVIHKSMLSALNHGGPFPSNANAGKGTRGEGVMEGVVTQYLDSKPSPSTGKERGKKRHSERKAKSGNARSGRQERG